MCYTASFKSVIFLLCWFDGNLRILTAEFYHLLRSLWCIILLYKSDQTPFYPTRNRDEPFEEWGLRDLNYLSDLAYLVFCKNDIIWWVRFLWQPTFFYHRIFFLSNRLFELACIFSCLHICSLFPQEFLSFLPKMYNGLQFLCHQFSGFIECLEVPCHLIGWSLVEVITSRFRCLCSWWGGLVASTLRPGAM